MVEPLLQELINMGLLLKINGGLKSGKNVINIYVKVLPSAITMNTVDKFVTDYLDQVNIPWVLYSQSCKQLVLPSPSAVLSEESNVLFHTGSYAR